MPPVMTVTLSCGLGMKDASYNLSYSPTLRASVLRRVFISKDSIVLDVLLFPLRTILTRMLRYAYVSETHTPLIMADRAFSALTTAQHDG
jgi:hypothetical protein